ncbi:MAG: hypothetical protein IJW47_01565 [Clostridia bacterium]|nr:hypothetical protein [Clostridia bacterium]
MTAEQTLKLLISLISNYLDQLNALPHEDFIDGELTAYTDCLEIVSRWSDFENLRSVFCKNQSS